MLIITWFDLWLTSKRREWIKSQGSHLLEIKIPREMLKSPASMETFLEIMHQPSVGSVWDVFFKGRVRPWFSLEIASIGGSIHFYIWTMTKFKNLIESHLYAQFPNIEISEVADYTLGVHRDPSKINIAWFGQFTLTKPDAFPIKTYIDYGLDKDPKEEFKNDPLVPLLEFMGSLRKGENIWIQILIQAHAKEGLKYGRITAKPDWTKAARKEIAKFVKENTPKDPNRPEPTQRDLSRTNQDVIAAIERTLGKPAFDTMIRGVYFADNDVLDKNRIGGLAGGFKSFSSNTLNGFKPGYNTGDYDYPWQDFRGTDKAHYEKVLLEAYKRRSFFNTPFKNLKGTSYILTTEELATLWHFPGVVAGTPTLNRIPSKKAEAPSNLPI
ncbi:MAG: hypothetical protein JWL80_674 [Parcubacteria group bacterium]|nr:hypothetical protein [Parcubacteria group bacterium]